MVEYHENRYEHDAAKGQASFRASNFLPSTTSTRHTWRTCVSAAVLPVLNPYPAKMENMVSS